MEQKMKLELPENRYAISLAHKIIQEIHRFMPVTEREYYSPGSMAAHTPRAALYERIKVICIDHLKQHSEVVDHLTEKLMDIAIAARNTGYTQPVRANLIEERSTNHEATDHPNTPGPTPGGSSPDRSAG